MLADIDGSEDFAIHRTCLANDGAKTDAIPQKAILGQIAGGAVHLCAHHQNQQRKIEQVLQQMNNKQREKKHSRR